MPQIEILNVTQSDIERCKAILNNRPRTIDWDTKDVVGVAVTRFLLRLIREEEEAEHDNRTVS